MGDQTTIFVRQAVAGEDQAIEWIVANFQPMVESQVRLRLRGQGQPQDVEDLAAEVWMTTLSRLGDLQERDGRLAPVLVKFLGTTVLQTCNNFLRRRIRREVQGGGDAQGDGRTGLLDGLPDFTRGIVTRAIQRDLDSAIRGCVDELAPDDRDVLVLRLMEQRTNQEIGALLGVPANTIAVRYRRALDKLRATLPKDLYDEICAEA